MTRAAATDLRHALVVGAGAVGVLWGDALRTAGLSVSFLVRENARATVAAGVSLVDAHQKSLRTWVPTAAVTSIDALPAPPELVVITVPSTSTFQPTGEPEPWLVQLCQRLPPDATLVSLSPGYDDAHRLRALLDDVRIVDGLIASVSYQTPLNGGALVPGLPPQHVPWGEPHAVVVWHPPFARSGLSGPRAAQVAALLNAGGLPAHVVDDANQKRAFGSALLMPVIAALEVAGWRLRGLADALGRAAQQSLLTVGRDRGQSPGPLLWAAHPLVLRVAAIVAPHVVPIPLEDYLRYHFTKVGAQTRKMLEEIARRAPPGTAPELLRLQRQLPPQP
jgi:ketopantoate reductase